MQRGRTENRSEFKHLSETSKVKADIQYILFPIRKNYDRAKPEAFYIQFEQRDKLTIPLFLESETFFLLYRLSGVSENIEDAEHKPEFNLSK